MQGGRPRWMCIMRLFRQMMSSVTRVGCFPTNLIDIPAYAMTRASYGWWQQPFVKRKVWEQSVK